MRPRNVPGGGADTPRTRRRRHGGRRRARTRTAIVERLFQSAARSPPRPVSVRSHRVRILASAAVPTGEAPLPWRRAGGLPASAERIEIHCHGGSAAVDQVLARSPQPAARRCRPPSGCSAVRPDRLIAEARLALAQARTLRVAAVLLDQYRGALSRSVVQAIQHIAAGRLMPLRSTRCARCWPGRSFGQRLIHPWQVVLVGKTNAGKSSLLNATAGLPAIVGRPRGRHDPRRVDRPDGRRQAGRSNWPTRPVRAPRPASWSPRASARAARHVAAADLVLVVSDVSTAWSDEDEQWVRIAAAGADHRAQQVRSGPRRSRRIVPPECATSAITAAGLPELLDVVAQPTGARSPRHRGTAVPFLEHHRQGLVAARSQALDQADDS